jgi:hypothetical protein
MSKPPIILAARSSHRSHAFQRICAEHSSRSIPVNKRGVFVQIPSEEYDDEAAYI